MSTLKTHKIKGKKSKNTSLKFDVPTKQSGWLLWNWGLGIEKDKKSA